MKKTGSKTLIDSSVWLLYLFAESTRAKEIIEREGLLLTSVISLFEIKRKLIRNSYGHEQINKSFECIKQRSIIVELSEEICEEAANLSVKLDLPAIDSLIYTSAIKNNASLITADNDFRGKKNVEMI
jgi:predicted nucleic acid-binding protein